MYIVYIKYIYDVIFIFYWLVSVHSISQSVHSSPMIISAPLNILFFQVSRSRSTKARQSPWSGKVAVENPPPCNFQNDSMMSSTAMWLVDIIPQ